MSIPWIVYGVGCLLFYRFAVRSVRRWDEGSVRRCGRSCQWSDVVGYMVIGAVLAALWPLWIIPEVVERLVRRLTWRQSRTPEDFLLFVGGQSRSERLKRQADRITELERELGIGEKGGK